MIQSSSLDVPYRTIFTNGSHDSIADVPIVKGGAGKGFGPHELLEAAFATCLTMSVQMHAVKHDIPLKSAQCEVRLDRSVNDIVTLKYHLILDGPLTKAQIAQLQEAASKCPVGRTLTGNIAIQSIKPVADISEGAG